MTTNNNQKDPKTKSESKKKDYLKTFSKILPYLLLSIALFLIVWDTERALYYILGSILVVIIYAIILSNNLAKFFKKNILSFLLVLSAFIFGVFKGDNNFWNDFEESSIVITIVYSIVIYVTLYRDKKVKKDALLKAFPYLVFGIIFMLVSVIAGVGKGINIETGNGFGVSVSGDRQVTMGLLALGTLFYAMVNYVLMNGESTFSDTYKKSLQYSDIPVVITFLLLWASTFELGNGCANNYEAFYGGAVAFQMLYSNIVWVFIDDPIIETMFK